MRFIINNQQKMHDIIFTDRNKNYGAYLLRSSYSRNLLRSLVTVLVTCVLLILGLSSFSAAHSKPVTAAPCFIQQQTQFNLMPPQDEPKLVKPASIQQKHAANLPVNRVSSADIAIKDSASAVPEKQHQAAHQNNSARDSAAASGKSLMITGKNEPAIIRIKKPRKPDSLPDIADSAAIPSVNLKEFISVNIRYPSEALIFQKQGMGLVSFIVDENGNILNATELYSPGFGMSEECLRVINLLPPFKRPAYKNGKPVRSLVWLPIRFKIK